LGTLEIRILLKDRQLGMFGIDFKFKMIHKVSFENVDGTDHKDMRDLSKK
jgi:hypothetical protein